jgi:hypothetical protein
MGFMADTAKASSGALRPGHAPLQGEYSVWVSSKAVGALQLFRALLRMDVARLGGGAVQRRESIRINVRGGGCALATRVCAKVCWLPSQWQPQQSRAEPVCALACVCSRGVTAQLHLLAEPKPKQRRDTVAMGRPTNPPNKRRCAGAWDWSEAIKQEGG